ncbi:MAG: DNA-3-methyladenine glycosylase 2 family protein [Elusimicrobia bacterium]|nr:DNA-3-methyladenine glycosylase 2 family protein [Elusimicrobiota bacterium]
MTIGQVAKNDVVLGRIIRRVGPCRLPAKPARGGYFEALVESIVYQQLNGKAAGTIFERFRNLYPKGKFPFPEKILATPEAKLRAAGLSKQKLSYIRDLAAKTAAGELDFDAFPHMADEDIIEALSRVKGIGRWTAEMFLIFTLARPDVLPAGDYGFRTAVMKAYGLKKMPDASKLQKLGEAWRPHRSAATWYFWQSLDMNPK